MVAGSATIAAHRAGPRAAGGRVAEQVGGRLVTGEQEPEQDRRHLLLGERRAAVVRRVDEVRREVGPRLGPTILGERLAVPPERRHAGGDVDLLDLGRPAEHEQQPVSGALLDGGDVVGGTPRISKTTSAGSSHVRADTISARPSWRCSSTKRRTRSRTNGSIAATRRGLNARCAMRRVRVGRRVDVGQRRDRAEPAVGEACAAAGHGGMSGASAFAAENVSYSRSTRRASECATRPSSRARPTRTRAAARRSARTVDTGQPTPIHRTGRSRSLFVNLTHHHSPPFLAPDSHLALTSGD